MALDRVTLTKGRKLLFSDIPSIFRVPTVRWTFGYLKHSLVGQGNRFWNTRNLLPAGSKLYVVPSDFRQCALHIQKYSLQIQNDTFSWSSTDRKIGAASTFPSTAFIEAFELTVDHVGRITREGLATAIFSTVDTKDDSQRTDVPR